MIHIEELERRFADMVAVDRISLHVPEGEVLGFLGPNGAGKTTTIRILTGFLPATSGRVKIAGFDVATQSMQVRRRIGYCPENVPLPVDARVDEYLDYRARLKGLGARERKRAQDQALEHCGLLDMRRRIVGQLSRGYRQRVGLADALLGDPPVLIWDEPTGGLDPGQRQDVLDLVGSLRGHKTVLLSSHVLTEVEHVCSRVAIICRGKLVADGTKDSLLATAGRRGEVLIGIDGEDDVLESWLGARDTPARREGPGRWIVSPGGEAAERELLRALVDAGFPVRRYEPQTRSLHEIFLELTQGGGR